MPFASSCHLQPLPADFGYRNLRYVKRSFPEALSPAQHHAGMSFSSKGACGPDVPVLEGTSRFRTEAGLSLSRDAEMIKPVS